jgi:hypothetical protein
MSKHIELGLRPDLPSAETEASNQVEEVKPDKSVREAGAERLARGLSSLSNTKEKIKNGFISIYSRAKGMTQAGLETVLGTPEAVKLGLNYTDKKSQDIHESVMAMQDSLVDKVDNFFINTGEKVESGIQKGTEIKDKIVERARESYRSLEERAWQTTSTFNEKIQEARMNAQEKLSQAKETIDNVQFWMAYRKLNKAMENFNRVAEKTGRTDLLYNYTESSQSNIAA